MVSKLKLLAAGLLLAGLQAHAQTTSPASDIDAMMKAVRSADSNGLEEVSVVRQAALREGAVVMGAREGLRVQSCAIRDEINSRREVLDKEYRFGDLMMGRGILPPVISEVRDSVTLEDRVMRVASRLYKIEENVRVVDVPPTWRDWLLVGLSTDDCDKSAAAPEIDQLRPKGAAEEAVFRKVLERSYDLGREQAKQTLRENAARLKRSYEGMRSYFDLYARGMVSAPIIATSTDIVDREDPNIMIVGNTIIRITVPVEFVDKHQQWRPLGQ